MEIAATLLGVFWWALMIVLAFTFGPALFSGAVAALILYVATAGLAFVVIRGLFSLLAVLPEDRLVVAAYCAAPILVLDILLILGAPVLGEALSGPAGRWFAAWLLVSPTIMLLTGIRMRKPVT